MAWQISPKLWRKLKPRATDMRNEPTEAEERLWEASQRKQVPGLPFRRQQTIDRFIADFVCPPARLIVEVDGPIHDHQQEADALRQQHLERLGYQVLRVRNGQVMANRSAVVREIARALQARLEALQK